MDTAVFHFSPASSDAAIVAFSAQGLAPGKFHFFGLLKFFPDLAKLLVRDPSENWFNTGLPDVGEHVDDIARRISQELVRLGADRFVTIGSSMGGYAAILFGCMLGAERAISLVPQTLLHPDLPFRAPDAGVRLQVPDLCPVIRDRGGPQIDVVVGWDDMVDVFHAQRIAFSPKVRVLGVPGTHSFASDFSQEDAYWPFVTDLIQGNTPKVCEVKHQFSGVLLKQIDQAVFAFGRREWKAAVTILDAITERCPEWRAPGLLASKARPRAS